METHMQNSGSLSHMKKNSILKWDWYLNGKNQGLKTLDEVFLHFIMMNKMMGMRIRKSGRKE